MNADELRPILTAYRRQVEKAWSEETAHPDFKGAAGSPVGQCGVTSAWLQERLLEDHGIGSWYCVGQVWLRGDRVSDDHCWLETGEELERVVIDLTTDQIPSVSGRRVLCENWVDLVRSGVHYWSFAVHDYDDILLDPVIDRLTLLKAALS